MKRRLFGLLSVCTFSMMLLITACSKSDNGNSTNDVDNTAINKEVEAGTQNTEKDSENTKTLATSNSEKGQNSGDSAKARMVKWLRMKPVQKRWL